MQQQVKLQHISLIARKLKGDKEDLKARCSRTEGKREKAMERVTRRKGVGRKSCNQGKARMYRRTGIRKGAKDDTG